MKTFTKLISTCVVLLLCTAMAYSQNYVEAKTSNESFQTVGAENNFYATQTAQINRSNSSNSVFISQVGNNNNVVSRTTSESSDIKYFQEGDNNDIFVSLNARNIEETIVQDGNNNSVLNFNNAQLDFHKGEIIQTGNNQNLTWYGGNSLSDKLKVSMQGNGQTVIVRNFN